MLEDKLCTRQRETAPKPPKLFF